MRKALIGIAALVALLYAVATVDGIRAQTRAALSGTVSSADDGPMEGVLVSAKRANSNITVTVVSNAQGRYAFPAAEARPGDVRALDSSRRLRSRRSEVGRRRTARRRDGRRAPEEDDRSRGAAQQRRMDRQRPRDRRPKTHAARLRRLPHAAAHRQLPLHGRRVHAGDPADGRLCARDDPVAARAAREHRRAHAIRRNCAPWPSSWPAST